jgi:hypothetical protein
MKVYSTASVLSGKLGVDEGIYRNKCWTVVKAIASLKERVVSALFCFYEKMNILNLINKPLACFLKIKFENRLLNQNGSICKLSVDGTDFRIHEPTPFWSGWFSHKFNGPGLRYEVGICIQTGWICWVLGPFACGKWSDLRIFKAKLKNMLAPMEKVEADGGYSGDIRISDPQDGNNVYEMRMKSAARARHETVNRRFKQFECMKNFRHGKVLHGHLFDAVATITQIGFENGEPPYQVRYERHNNI